MKSKMILGVVVLAVGLGLMFGCAQKEPLPLEVAAPQSDPGILAKQTNTGGQEEGTVSPIFDAMNAELEARGLDVRASMAEWVTDPTEPGDDEFGQTIFANNRAKQLGHHWVPGDPRRGGRTNITYLVDKSDGVAKAPLGGTLSNAQTEGAIDRAMDTWHDVQCSNIPIVKVPDSGIDPDIRDFLAPPLGSFGGFGTPFLADIVHAGWLPGGFFNTLAPGGATRILGVTFTFIFVSGGVPTDIDGNGKLDVAFREIYYNNNFEWGINVSTRPFDVETVALHEAGHGLSQGHFGKIFRTESNGVLHFSPFAVMNAAISRQAQDLEGTDNGGHCSIWAQWPNH